MKSQWRRLLPVLFLAICGVSGCGDEPPPDAQNRRPAADKAKATAARPNPAEKTDATPEKTKAAGSGTASRSDLMARPKHVLDAAVVAQRDCSQSLRLPLRTTNSIGMRLVLIPDGEFVMGTADSGANVPNWEKPPHKVRITNPFYLSTTEVTQVEYQKVMAENPSYFKSAGNPVEQASWYDATEFCRRLSATEGTTYRLPTETEWEYACRAGTTTPYNFGDDLADLDRYAWCDSTQTHPAGTRRPNTWGLYDMHGNVAEWCADRWGENYYAASPADDPTGPETGSLRVIRGGGWKDAAADCRSAARGGFVPAGRLRHLGFRVAADPSGFQSARRSRE